MHDLHDKSPSNSDHAEAAVFMLLISAIVTTQAQSPLVPYEAATRVQFSSVQDGVYVLGKTHMSSTPVSQKLPPDILSNKHDHQSLRLA